MCFCFATLVPSKFSSHGRGGGVGRSRPSEAGGGGMSVGSSGRGNTFSSATRHKNALFNFITLQFPIFNYCHWILFSDFTSKYKYPYWLDCNLTRHLYFQNIFLFSFLWIVYCSISASGVTLNADLEPNIHHQTPMTCTHGYSHFIHFKTVQNRSGNTFFKYINFFVATVLEVPFSVLMKGVSQHFCPYNECTSHWCLVMGFCLKVCI